MPKIVVHIQEKDIESLIDVLQHGGDHYVSWSPIQSDTHKVQMILIPSEFAVLRYNFIDVETLPILP